LSQLTANLTSNRGLGALICEKFAAEGCNIAINYVSAADRAQQVAKTVTKKGVKVAILQGVCILNEMYLWSKSLMRSVVGRWKVGRL
jgi:NAD(P)-dependent dehydrogenase (short-subunit alcohol dehydrogenase family)